ncbi:DUF2163 domain-containing protein [Qipengyuania sp. JC766]|uniref:DUF2163 domain-containing protein n=1 Tax=Qipengyuania sp. JC766 TaxID=3232139 RepID=UPI0034594DF9
MSRVFRATALEPLATYWQVFRRDGLALGFVTHDRDLWFDGLLHRAGPGMVPGAIRLGSGFREDRADVEGLLSHAAIHEADLAAGRYDGAQVRIGMIDWETLERAELFAGTIGRVSRDGVRFNAELLSARARLDRTVTPLTSPTCRAAFCGKDCALSGERFTHEGIVSGSDADANAVVFEGIDAALFVHGHLRWLGGPHAGLTMDIVGDAGSGVVLDVPLDALPEPGTRALLREGCDHTLQTCATRFGNARNFRGEPFLPGNDLLARYPVSA